MCIFMLAPGSWQNGVPLVSPFIASQVESLRKTNWKVHLALLDDRTSLNGLWRNIQRLEDELTNVQPKLVHAQYGSVTAAMARWIADDKPLIVSFCGDDLLGTPNPGVVWRVREKIARCLGLWGAQKAIVIIVKSQNLFDALPPDLQSRVIIMPNGVDLEWFAPLDYESCRAELGWNTRAKIILFNTSQAGDRLRKNPSLAYAAVAHLGESMPDVHLHAISNASRWEMRILLNAADCLLVTSLHEGSPNIVKEAMACNLPIVSVPCGDVPQRLSHVKPSAVCPYDYDALAEGLRQVLQAECRSNGREQLIEQRLSTECVADRLSQIYLHAISGKGI